MWIWTPGPPASGAPTAIQITVDGTALFGTAADAMSYMQTSPSNYLAASTNYERYYEFVFPLKFQTSVVVAITSHGTLPTDRDGFHHILLRLRC